MPFSLSQKVQCSKCGNFIANTTIAAPLSPVPDLVASNAVPPQSEIGKIQDTIWGAQAEIIGIEEEISRAQSLIKHLQKARAVLQGFVQEHKMLLSPARRLYPELWSEIFLYCQRGAIPLGTEFRDILNVYDPREGPLLLTQVCREWRDIALATRMLWTTIRIDLSPHSPNQSSQLSLVHLWLARSGSFPLTVCIVVDEPSTSSPGPDQIVYVPIRAAIEHSRRWQNLHLFIPSSPAIWDSLSAAKGNFPQLRNLYVRGNRFGEHHGTRLELFDTTPQLTHISLDYDTSLSMMKTTCLQLTTIKIFMGAKTSASLNTCLEVLHQCPNLLEASFNCKDFLPVIRPAAVHHYKLQKLTIVAARSDSGLGDFMNNLIVPFLVELKVYSMHNFRPWDHQQFVSLLARSPNLQRLALHASEVLEKNIIEYLSYTPTLIHLILETSPRLLTDITLRGLTVASRVGKDPKWIPILPKLQSLEITGTALFSSRCFAALLKSRWTPAGNEDKPVACLLSARLVSKYKIMLTDPIPEREEPAAQLEELRREGMDIQVPWSHWPGTSSNSFDFITAYKRHE